LIKNHKKRILFFFDCPKCGFYTVSKKSFQHFLLSEEWEKLEEKILKEGAVAGKIKFSNHCPKCAPYKSYICKPVAIRKLKK
jgi:hypothetical protein